MTTVVARGRNDVLMKAGLMAATTKKTRCLPRGTSCHSLSHIRLSRRQEELMYGGGGITALCNVGEGEPNALRHEGRERRRDERDETENERKGHRIPSHGMKNYS